MKKYYFHSLLTITALFIITSLSAQNPIILTSGSGNWYPPPGCKSFYVQLWGGGAGGNTQLSTPCICTSETGGGGGGSFSQSNVFTVTAATQASGYSYTVGAGGGYNVDGEDSKFENCWAYRGLRKTLTKQKYVGPDIALSYFGGYGGSSYRDLGAIYYGGGGGSAYTNADGNNGGNGVCCVQGSVGTGTGNGGGAGIDDAKTPGGGGPGNAAGARGEIRIFYTCEYTPGTIGNEHTVPFPAEFTTGNDVITNLTLPTGFGYTYSWQSSTDNVTWTSTPGNGQTLAIGSINKDTYYRRVINGCGTNNASNAVPITVFSQGNGKKNGTISGRVVSKNSSTGVGGDTITAIKTVALNGSPASYAYTAITDADGYYSIQNIFYGDINNGDPPSVDFTITPSKQGHVFAPATRTLNLSNTNPSSTTGNGFTDNTVYAITGNVTQRCDSCLDGYMGPFGVGNVKISANDLAVVEVYSDSLKEGSIGSFGITVADPKTYTFTPTYLNHKFLPLSRTISVTADVDSTDFADTATRVISGKLTDAAGKRIGSGSLIFEGIYQRKDSAAITTFKRRAFISTNDSTYSVRLPAGSNYKVTVETFAPAFASTDDRYILEDSLKNFFNYWAVEPSIDISIKDSVRNLVYHRPPVIVLTGLKDTACNTNPDKNPGIVFRTNVPRRFQVNVFEGPPGLGDRVQTTAGNNEADPFADYVRIYTNITKRKATDNADTLFFRLKNSAISAMLDSVFIPGAPNTIAPNTKPFELHYIDRYGRKATPLKPKSTVVGTFNPANTFTTAFPEKPTLILHAPPGDQSYSYWSKDTSVEKSIAYSVANDNGVDGFVNVSVGPTVSIGDPFSVSADVAVIATGSYTHVYETNYASGNELVETTTSNINFQTTKSGVVNGTTGDVFIGSGINYILGKSIFVDFAEGLPANACEIKVDEKLFLGPDSIRTEFAYAEDHIINVIIPQQQRLADEATDPVKRDEYLTQVSVWQQVIENNTINKKNAGFVRNRSFSNGVIVDESQTSTRSNNNTITYDVTVGHEIAAELGLRIANVGASGGANITIMETTSNDTTTSNSVATTMGYHLEDQNPGDYYSVDIKKDPVYGTPVFGLVGGTSSCPPEEGAQNRDMPQILSGDMRLVDLDPATAKFFTITIANKSESGEARFYDLSVDGTTSEGLVISSSGSTNLVTNQVPFYLAYGESKDVQIKVEKFNKTDKILSYPNVEFYFTDNCGTLFVPNTINTAKISFNYTSTCGNIAMAAPLDGWVANSGNTNILPVTMNGYTLSSIDSVTLQYKKLGTNIWKTGFTVKKAAISDPNSFTYPWNIASLTDSVYNIRLRLVCQDGSIIYSAENRGVVDKQGPSLVGKPQPATQRYNPEGNEISFTYNESLNKSNLNQGVVELVRRSDNTLVPVSVNELDGKLIISPLNSLGNTIDSFRVIVNNIADLYGNVKTKPDTSFFKLDFTPQVTYTGSNVATAHVVNASIAENSPGKIEIHFKLREITNKVTRVYFNLSGTALFNTDYTISYDTIKQKKCATGACNSFVYLPVYNQFSGSPGYVNIDSNKTETIIYITPKEDFENEGDETIRVSLVSGADYKLQDSVLAIATILNSALACPQGNIFYVNRNATGNNSGTSWQNAMTSLQDALNSTCPGITEVWVARGTYKPTTNTKRDSAFALKNNLAIYGGFAGTETLVTERNWNSNPTILSGDIGIPNNNTDNTYTIIANTAIDATAVLDGFTITGGNSNAIGGAMSNNNSSPVIRNCIFKANTAASWAGAVYNGASSNASFTNCLFTRDSAGVGGAMFNSSSSPVITNCTFSGNYSPSGSAIWSQTNSFANLTNCIVWGNDGSAALVATSTSPFTVSYSITQEAMAGTGNLVADPIFIYPSGGDYRLNPCSPAINAGTAAGAPATDILGFPRPASGGYDMGAYERQSLALSTTIYVDAAATGNNSGESWVNAYNNFSSALNELNFCAPGTTIQVASGVYTAPLNSTYNFGKPGATILGGYPNGGGNRNPVTYSTILKGNVQVLKSMTMDGIRVQQP